MWVIKRGCEWEESIVEVGKGIWRADRVCYVSVYLHSLPFPTLLFLLYCCHGIADLINFSTQKAATATQKLFIIIQMIHDNKMHKLNHNFFSTSLIVVFTWGVSA